MNSEQTPDGLRRRSTDPVISSLAKEVQTLQEQYEELRSKLTENTVLTKEVLAVLKSFKLMGAIIKWGGVLAGGLAGLWAFGGHLADVYQAMRRP